MRPNGAVRTGETTARRAFCCHIKHAGPKSGRRIAGYVRPIRGRHWHTRSAMLGHARACRILTEPVRAENATGPDVRTGRASGRLMNGQPAGSARGDLFMPGIAPVDLPVRP